MATTHRTLYEAVKAAQPVLERDGLLLDDGATYWSADNLLTELYNAATDYDTDDTDGYYITAIDGSVGYTTNGYNVQWIYKAVARRDTERHS